MDCAALSKVAQALIANGKGILAADETVPTIGKRLAAQSIESTPESRRIYREMFFTTPAVSTYISGAILQDETIRQKNDRQIAIPELLDKQGIIPGIKVDNGARPLASFPGERITEGLDNLRERLQEYVRLGARFAKWRAVIEVTKALPSTWCVLANAHALARYAAMCQEQNVVPIVEPEVLMDGEHDIHRCEEVTTNVLHAVFGALFEQKVHLEGILLKPNMIISAKSCAKQASVDEVARATVRCLRRSVPPVVAGIVFLSGGQDHRIATEHLNAINRQKGPKPWKLSFSYGRALQDEALVAWQGKSENFLAGQQAFYRRARCAGAATLGEYTNSMEDESRAA